MSRNAKVTQRNAGQPVGCRRTRLGVLILLNYLPGLRISQSCRARLPLPLKGFFGYQLSILNQPVLK